jgi:hypothetical protein
MACWGAWYLWDADKKKLLNLRSLRADSSLFPMKTHAFATGAQFTCVVGDTQVFCEPDGIRTGYDPVGFFEFFEGLPFWSENPVLPR